MKSAAACAALLVASSHAFMAPGPSMSMSAETTSRRAVLGNVFAAATAAAVVLPQVAFADGAVSEATVQRARGVYGDRILALSGAVQKGDFAAVAAEKNAFTILSTSGFAMSPKADKIAAKALAAKINTAAAKGDGAGLKTAYDQLLTLSKLKDTPSTGDNQGYSSDYDWKRGTKRGTIYIR